MYRNFRVYTESNLRGLIRGSGITEVAKEDRPKGMLLVACVDQRLWVDAGIPAKIEKVYYCKPFVRTVEGPVRAIALNDEVHVDSIAQTYYNLSREKGIDALCLDAHSRCAMIPEANLTEQLKLMIQAFHSLRTSGEIKTRMIGAVTKLQPGRWKTIVVFDTDVAFPVLAGSPEEAELRERGLIVA